MDDLLACAELCESHGFEAPAALLRDLAAGKAPFFLVRSTDRGDYDFEELWIDPDHFQSPARKLFRDRAAAERHAQALTVRALRDLRPDLRYGPPSHLEDDQFAAEVATILGASYTLPTEPGAPLFPDAATDAQMVRLGQLLDIPLFEVAEIGEPHGTDSSSEPRP